MRVLIVELADIGDLILSTPALSALREAQPDAHIALLTTAHSAPILDNTGLVDEIILFDKHTFDSPKALLKPANFRLALALAARLRRGRCDTALFFHHFSTRFGALKFAALALSAGSKRRLGLQNGNAPFLTESLPDGGFGAKHQAQYWLDLVGLLGADSSPRPAVVNKETPPDEFLVAATGISETDAKNRVPTNQDATVGTPFAELVRTASTFPETANNLPSPRLRGRGVGGEGSPLRIAIHPGSGGYSLARRWDAEKFAAVADTLHDEYNAQIILVGGPNDDGGKVRAAMRTAPFDLTGQTTLGQLAGVLASCDLFIGADSGVMHIAAAAGTPLVAVFGPSNAPAWGPWTPTGKSVVIRSAPECSPCSYIGYGVGLRNGCAARTCMRMVTAEQVLQAARELLEGKIPPQLPSEPVVGVNRRFAPTAPPRFPRRVRVLGLPVDAITYDEWLALIETWVKETPPPASPTLRIQGGESTVSAALPHHVCTINPEFIMIAQKDVNFHNILSRADLCVPDGVGLLWAAKHIGHPLPERVTGSDGVPKIAERAAQTGWRLFFLGAAPGAADKAAEILRARHPGLQIVGVYSGSPAPEEEDALVERVNTSGADILFVAYGAPEQDKWIARNLPRLRVKMAMGVGGSLDFVAGVIPRAPQWMQRMNLEWLYRLYLQPWRIRRMMRLPLFVLAVLRRGGG